MNEIQLYTKLNDPVSAIERIGKMFAKSGMFGCDKQEQGEVLAMICLAENKSPVEITRTYHIVEGKLSKKALAQLAEFRSKGGKHRWLKSGDDAAAKDEDRKAEGEFTVEGVTVKYAYSIADAKMEGVLRPNSRWTKRPGNMLRARCITNALGMLMPEIVAGEDNDSDNYHEPTATLDLGKAPVETAAKPAAPIVETEIVQPLQNPADTEKELAAAGLAPAQPADASKPFTAEADANGLTSKTCIAITKALGEQHAEAVSKWLDSAKWMVGNDMRTLSVKRAQQILTNPKGFLAHAKIV